MAPRYDDSQRVFPIIIVSTRYQDVSNMENPPEVIGSTTPKLLRGLQYTVYDDRVAPEVPKDFTERRTHNEKMRGRRGGENERPGTVRPRNDFPHGGIITLAIEKRLADRRKERGILGIEGLPGYIKPESKHFGPNARIASESEIDDRVLGTASLPVKIDERVRDSNGYPYTLGLSRFGWIEIENLKKHDVSRITNPSGPSCQDPS
ncbi:hypothetical protein BDZ94DRAFT_1233275 [Collybia nuda]|uniref:Uncharacterized protein n=1 Tax=Collybia nuda TaxID=64659 RepID=A0A9P6CI18_9AGAR|nr:hypothetical protein BDZ94DRAFT_1233275 [Collybia nuda]